MGEWGGMIQAEGISPLNSVCDAKASTRLAEVLLKTGQLK